MPYQSGSTALISRASACQILTFKCVATTWPSHQTPRDDFRLLTVQSTLKATKPVAASLHTTTATRRSWSILGACYCCTCPRTTIVKLPILHVIKRGLHAYSVLNILWALHIQGVVYTSLVLMGLVQKGVASHSLPRLCQGDPCVAVSQAR